MAERFYFHRRIQAAGESIVNFMHGLRKMPRDSNSRGFLDEALRDQFVSRLHSEPIQSRLLTEDDLDLEKAMKIAQGMEAAKRDAHRLKDTDAVVARVNDDTRPCYRCGKSNHLPSACRFKEAKCHACGKKGHISAVCRSKPKQTRKVKKAKAKYVRAQDTDSDSDSLPVLLVGDRRSTHPITVQVSINGKSLTMEVDTGAAVSIISEKTSKGLFPDAAQEKGQACSAEIGFATSALTGRPSD